jgi:hypothetical protein
MEDVHLGVAACSASARWFAIRLASGSLPDFLTVLIRGRGSYWDYIETFPRLARCPRCGSNCADGPFHWVFECPGLNSVARDVRERHREIVLRHIGVDVLDGENRWWLLPLVAGHVHPVAFKFCSRISRGKLQWADTRHKVLYLMVRVVRMGLDMWHARCQDIYAFPPGSQEANQRELVFGSLRQPGPCKAAKPDAVADAFEQAEVLAQEEAKAPLDQSDIPVQSELEELCSRCQKRMRHVLICHCGARHCCGDESGCVFCAIVEAPQEDGFINPVDPDDCDDLQHQARLTLC